MYAYKYDSDFYYAGQQDCQLDPLESKKQGHPVYLLPANCTWKEPLNEKEGYKIKWNGEAWEYEEIPVPPEPEPPTLDDVKAQKIAELKSIRDTKEVEPIRTDKGIFDYDDKSRDRLYIARQALTDAGGGEIVWTTADNQRVSMGIADFAAINGAAAVRSNSLHIKYNELKQRVNAAQTVEEVEAIHWSAEGEGSK